MLGLPTKKPEAANKLILDIKYISVYIIACLQSEYLWGMAASLPTIIKLVRMSITIKKLSFWIVFALPTILTIAFILFSEKCDQYIYFSNKRSLQMKLIESSLIITFKR